MTEFVVCPKLPAIVRGAGQAWVPVQTLVVRGLGIKGTQGPRPEEKEIDQHFW
jgi:hypothetical protein